MSDEIRTEIERAKANLDKLADALDRVATEPELRTRLAAQPLDTLLEMGFNFDEESRQEILEMAVKDASNMEEWIGIWSASAVKSGIRSGIKAGVSSAASTAVKSGVKTVIKNAREEAGKPGGGGKPAAGKQGTAGKPVAAAGAVAEKGKAPKKKAPPKTKK